MNRMMHIIAAGIALSVAHPACAANISDFAAGGDLVISASGEITVDADATFSSITIAADGVSFVNPDAATTNTLTVTKVYNTSSTIPVFNCRVVFEDEWTASVPIWVSATSQPVDFAGGVVGTYPDPQTASARTLKGRYILNGNWTIPGGSLTFTVPSGSTLTGRKVTGAGGRYTYSTLFIDDGAYADIDHIAQEEWTMHVSVNGTLKVNLFNVLRGNVGNQGNTGTLIVDWLVMSPTAYGRHMRLFIPNVVFGGLFDWNQLTRLSMASASEVNFRFTENAKWGGAGTYVMSHRTGGDVIFNTQDPDTGVGYVVELERGLDDNDDSDYGVVGKGHLNKNGMGALIFGDGIPVTYNIYSGGTTINQGMVANKIEGARIGTGTVTVNSGGVVNPAGGGSLVYPIVVNDGGTAIFPANTTASSLTLNSGSTLQVSAAHTLTATALTLPESGTVNLLVTGGSTTNGPVTLISFPSGMTSTEDDAVNAALLAKFSLVRNNGTLAIDAANNALVMTDYTAPTFSWVGGTDNKFSTAANWSSGYAPAPGDAIEFAASAGGSLTNDIVGLGFNTTVTFAEGAGQFSIAGEPFVCVTNLYNGASYLQTLNNAVHCMGTINLTCTAGKMIDFAGGIIGTTPNCVGSTSRILTGKWRYTDAWTQPISTTYTISDGSSLYGRSYEYQGWSNQGSNRPTLRFQSGSYGEFRDMSIGYQRNILDIIGHVKTRIFKTGGGIAGTYESSGIFDVTELFWFYNSAQACDCRYHYTRLGDSMNTTVATSKNTNIGGNSNTISGAHGATIQASADVTISTDNGLGYGYRPYKMMEFDTEDNTSGVGHTITMNASVIQNSSTFVRKIGKGTVVLNGTANTYANGCYVNGGTLIANHATACGTGATTVADGAIFAVTNGEVSVTASSATLAEGATLAVGVTDRSSAAIANTLVVNGAATLQVMGDVSSLTESTNIPLAGTCTAASLANLSLDSSRLTLPNGGWRVKVKLEGGALALRVIRPPFVLLVR